MTTILHVEDDTTLAETVRDAFEAFGFRGNYLLAASVADARRILGNTPSSQDPDLIISDMQLPDGTGLDIVQFVRTDPLRRHVPIVILSGDVSPSLVNRAYVLGANSYVGKDVRGRSIAETMKILYGHWLRDARLPSPATTTRTLRYASTAVDLRTRFARAYLRIAEQLEPSSADLWMDLALREGNIANLLEFLVSQLGDREVPDDVLDAAEAAQRVQAEQLAMLERHDVRTRADAEQYLRVMTAAVRAEPIARVIAHFFPIVPVAMTALRESGATGLERIADWIEMYSADRELRARVPGLRGDAARIRS